MSALAATPQHAEAKGIRQKLNLEDAATLTRYAVQWYKDQTLA